MTEGMLQSLPLWARGVIYGGGGLAAASVQLGSSLSLYQLGMDAGQGTLRAALLPIALDAGAVVAATLWVASEDEEHRQAGRRITLGLVAGSMAFNALEALVHWGKFPAERVWLITVAIAILFPLASALVGHLVLLVRSSAAAAAAERKRAEKAQAEQERQRRIAAAADEEKRARLDQLDRDGSKVQQLERHILTSWEKGIEKSAAAFERELFGSNKGNARKVIQALKAQGFGPKSTQRPKLQAVKQA